MLDHQDYSILRSAFEDAKTGGKTDVIQIAGATIAVQSAAYASGDVLGTGNPVEIEAIRFPNGTAILQSVALNDLSDQAGAVNVVVFGDNPSSTTFTDNSPLDIADADLPKRLGTISIIAADYVDFADNTGATKFGIGLPVKNFSTTASKKLKLWLAFVSMDTKTYVANEVSANIGFLQD